MGHEGMCGPLMTFQYELQKLAVDSATIKVANKVFQVFRTTVEPRWYIFQTVKDCTYDTGK